VLIHPSVNGGLDPAIHHLREKMDARVKPAHDVERGAIQINWETGLALRCDLIFATT
jgi:hypothetical protein